MAAKKPKEDKEDKREVSKRLKCSCHNEFQDKTYGVGVRLHTKQKDGWKCTVCGTLK